MRIKIHILLWIIVLVASSNGLSAQDIDRPTITLENPHNTMLVHLAYLQPDNFEPEKAAQTLTEVADSSKMSKLAIQLKQLFDGKGLYVPLSKIPQNPNYRDSSSNEFYYTPFPDELPQIYLEKLDGRWKYSTESVQSISKLHRKVYPFGADFLLKILPKSASQKILGIQIWQWLGIILLMLLAYLIHFILSRIIRPLLRMVTHSRLHLEFIPVPLMKRAAHLLSLLLLGWLLKLSVPALLLPIKMSGVLQKSISLFMIVIVMLIALLIVRIIAERGREIAMRTETKMDEQLIPILTRIAKILIVVVAIIYMLKLLHVNITALIAGVSIGGLALALAAQDTVKNLIGSIMIFTDRPFQLGDYISGSDFEGTVEEIGFRTTRVRTVDTSVIAVPNGSIANISVKNWGVRTFRLFDVMLDVQYNTSPDQIEAFIAKLKELILSHPKTNKESYYVHLRSMGENAIKIMFRCLLDTNMYAEELKMKEDLYLDILRIAQSLNISFAFPSRSIYIEQSDQKT